MPEGSSSEAPVTRPGPRIFRNRLKGLRSRRISPSFGSVGRAGSRRGSSSGSSSATGPEFASASRVMPRHPAHDLRYGSSATSNALERLEPARLGGDDVDAGTRPRKQSIAIGDADLPTGVTDQPRVLELAHRDREGRTLDTDHLGQELLGDLEWRLVDTLVHLKEPARRPLIEPVDPVAKNQLGHRDHHDLRVSLEERDESATVAEFLSQRTGFHPQSCQWYLDDRPDW